jgi:hypothetical protein
VFPDLFSFVKQKSPFTSMAEKQNLGLSLLHDFGIKTLRSILLTNFVAMTYHLTHRQLPQHSISPSFLKAYF